MLHSHLFSFSYYSIGLPCQLKVDPWFLGFSIYTPYVLWITCVVHLSGYTFCKGWYQSVVSKECFNKYCSVVIKNTFLFHVLSKQGLLGFLPSNWERFMFWCTHPNGQPLWTFSSRNDENHQGLESSNLTFS